MAWLRRISVYEWASAALLALLAVLAVRIAGDTGYGRIALLEEEIAERRAEADAYLQRNQLIAAQLQKIKSDAGQVEVLARYHFGMIKPDEVFIQTGR
ncbi:MAG: septum formation initiator family protein [Betaproteobacteria bacterium AqS2]|uniref:Septum formation initiator family protein n=1 Tax=Candidatus Amphirhobacter heronislandensis TaxID=1732024 RepID=A0A930UGF5_9GAMM|nr:septum formation initiator family protein [Betaproteobacteria bacterium AqS2]